MQLEAPKSAIALDDAVSKAAAGAANSSDPRGSRQGDAEMQTSSDAPVAAVEFMRMDTEEAEPPELMSTYTAGRAFHV